jgi:hypothetical protein
VPEKYRKNTKEEVVNRYLSKVLATVALVMATLGLPAGSWAALIGVTVSNADAMLYDVDPLTGSASNPRPTQNSLADITFAGSALFGLTTLTDNSLYRINPATGGPTLVGPTGLDSIIEGDLAYNAGTGTLYGLYQGTNVLGSPKDLFTLNLSTGAGTVVGPVAGADDPSGMAFDSLGNLFVIDSTVNPFPNTNPSRLLRVNPATGAVLATIDLSRKLDAVLGMDYDPISNTMFVVDTNLYTLNTATGLLTLLGPTGVGLMSGLAVVPAVVPAPEPPGIALFGLALASLFFIERSRRCHL